MIRRAPLIAIMTTVVLAAATTSAESAMGEPHDPASLGGELVFDGGHSEALSSHGFYAMIYLYRNITDETACQNLSQQWKPQDVQFFRKDGKSNPFFRTKERKFHGTDPAFPLHPQTSKEYYVENSVTESWEHSVGISVTVGTGESSPVKAEVTASYSFTYQNQVSTTKGEKTIINNVTNDQVIFYQYGITRDVFAMQVNPWRAMWVKEGDRLDVGDDHNAIARWYSVKEDGCYRIGMFSPFSFPRKGELEPIGKVHQKKYQQGQGVAAQCPMHVNGANVHPARKTTDENGVTTFEPVTTKKLDGECLTLQNEWNDDTGDTYYKTNVVGDDGGYLWVNENDIKFQNPGEAHKAKPLRGWEAGTIFSLRPKRDTTLAIKAYEDANHWKTYFGKVDPEPDNRSKWKLTATKTPGYWQFRNVEFPNSCLDVDERASTITREQCAEHDDQKFRVINAGDGTHYIQEKRGSGTYCFGSYGVPKEGEYVGNKAPDGTSEDLLWNLVEEK